MAKQLKFGSEARRLLKLGVDLTAKAVGATLGPKGRNVIYTRQYVPPTVTHDGVTVARELEAANPFINAGVQLVKEAASKTNDVAGDGTTTSTILAQAIVEQGLELVEKGANPMMLRKGIEDATLEVVEWLKSHAKPLKTHTERVQVATVSSGDPELGKLIATALDKVGKEGVVLTEQSSDLETKIEYKEGMEFSTGFVSPYFKTNEKGAELKDAKILVTDINLKADTDIVPLLEKLVPDGKQPLVVIAPEITGEALATLALNKTRGSWQLLGVKAPGFAEYQKDLLQDIAILVGAEYISEDKKQRMEEVTPAQLGFAKRVTATKDSTTIVDGAGTKEAVQARIKEIELAFKDAEKPVEKERLRIRMGKLSSGVAVIKVGAATEVELKEKHYRIEDALNATRAAIEEGIVPGGETALLMARRVLLTPDMDTVGDARLGRLVVYEALRKPFQTLMQNSGLTRYIIMPGTQWGCGINVLTGEYCNLIEAGIIDPVKVTRSALENASSVAIAILTGEVIIADIPENQPYLEEDDDWDPKKRRESYIKRLMPKKLDKAYQSFKARFMTDDKAWQDDIRSRTILPNGQVARTKERRGGLPGEIIEQPVEPY